jgi:basic membrane lipoprotein Med (substrate-binding protein (PBP1-ABC) superfamily)
MKNKIIKAIQKINLTHKLGTPPISKELILAKVAELQAEYEANQYQRDRAVAYPTIQEQLDMQYWDKINGTNNWQDAINAVKAQYPKV